MKLKFLCTAALALAAQTAAADDQTVTFSGLAARFNAIGTTLSGGDDIITFTGLTTGRYSFELGATGLNTFFSASSDLNGTLGTVEQMGSKISFIGVVGATQTPLVLTLRGTTAGSGLQSYSGLIEVSPVPEPGTAAMWLAGLAVAGFIARRRGKGD